MVKLRLFTIAIVLASVFACEKTKSVPTTKEHKEDDGHEHKESEHKEGDGHEHKESEHKEGDGHEHK